MAVGKGTGGRTGIGEIGTGMGELMTNPASYNPLTRRAGQGKGLIGMRSLGSMASSAPYSVSSSNGIMLWSCIKLLLSIHAALAIDAARKCEGRQTAAVADV